jgi:hypothetical protein
MLTHQTGTFLVQDIKVEHGDIFSLPSNEHISDGGSSMTVCYGVILDDSGRTIDASFLLEDLLRENTRVGISCTDCERRGFSDLHPYGLECGHCGSFNTCRM